MTPTTQIMDAAEVQTEITQYLGNVLDEAKKLAEAVKDDQSASQAAVLGTQVKTRVAWLKSKRAEIYEPLYAATERIRLEFDNPIKLGGQLEKTLAAAIIKFKQDKKREEDRLRLEAEANARRVREEAERKEREEEEERQRVIRDREARERKAREEAAAEERRIAVEAKAKEEAEKARLQREQDERARLMKAEEDARLAKAQEAEKVGLADRVESILETPEAIAPIAKPLPSSAELEAEKIRKRQEAEAEAETERQRQAKAAEEQRLRDEEAMRLKQMAEETERAKAEAARAEAEAAAQATVTTADSRMRTNVSAKYEISDEASFRKLVRAVAEGRAPLGFLGFDPEHPEKFRAPALGRHATAIKKDPDFSGKQSELAAIGVRVWLEEGGAFKAEEVTA